jgi:hypothetical protein
MKVGLPIEGCICGGTSVLELQWIVGHFGGFVGGRIRSWSHPQFSLACALFDVTTGICNCLFKDEMVVFVVVAMGHEPMVE